MRKTVARLGLVGSLLSVLWLTTGCGGNSSNNYTQPPPAAPTIAVLPTSAGVLVGQTQTFSLTVTGNPTVTCSVNGPGSCSVSGTTSASYTGAAPASGGDWKATLTLTATNAGGSATATVAITLGQITGITVSPATVALAMNMTQVFTATATGNGMFSSAVTWPALGTGMGSIVASDETHATYTPPQTGAQVQGFPAVTVTATGADGTTVGTATIGLGFVSIAYFAPSGQNDQATTGGAVSTASTTAMAVVADQRADGTAGLLLCNLQTGSCTDAWKNSLPSQINDIAAADGVTFYATGDEGAPPTQAMLPKIVLAGNALQVTKFVPDWQVASGVRAQGQLVKVDQSGNIYVAVNGDCPSSQSSSCVNVGGWVYEFGPDGSDKGNFPVAASFPVFVTGMDVEPSYIAIKFDTLSVTTGIVNSTDLALYVNGQLYGPYESGSGVYDARVFMNGTGDQALVGGQYDVSETTDRRFGLSSTAIDNGQINPYLPTFFAVWNGNNGGAMSINLAQSAIPNPWGGGDVLGSLSAVGSADPNGPTDGGLASWPGNPTPGSPTPLLYGLRFDPPHVPGGTISVLTGGKYYKAADGLWHLALWGNGSDGTACGAAACTKVVVADVIPQQQQSQ